MENDSEDIHSFGECRCCLAKGTHRDIQQEYYHNGVREVYRDLFVETFNLSLSETKGLTTLLCTRCISRLRDAQSLRALAIRTESHLLDAIKKNMEFVDVSANKEPTGDVKWEIHIKEELADHIDVEPTYDSDYLSVSECVESKQDLIPGEAELLARFSSTSRLPTRADLTRVMPNFVRHLEILKHGHVSAHSISLRSPARVPGAGAGAARDQKAAHAHNATTLIRYSNMTPFKSKHRDGFPCFYCRSVFDNFTLLKEHTAEHKHSELPRVFKYFGPESLIVYADVTDLACTICGSAMQSIPDLKKHLSIHGKTLYDVGDRVIPFLVGEQYLCPICSSRYETFGSIERHMNGHFRNYVCKVCGSGYATKYRLKVHHKSMHVEGKFECAVCAKVFATAQKRTNHCNAVHKMKKRFKCSKCSERFVEYFRRQKHLVEVHGLAPLKYNCNVCDRSFDRRYTLSRHLKRDHLEERENICNICNYSCFTKNELKVHMVKHTGERIFECAVCKKSYARKKTLKEHMRIHNNDRRFVCPACGQAFVQKCSLKGHMKTHHFEYSMP